MESREVEMKESRAYWKKRRAEARERAIKIKEQLGFIGPTTAVRNGGYWRDVEKLMPWIIDLHKDKMDSPPAEDVVMTKLIVRSAAGLCYYPTLSVKGEDGVTTMYEAKIWMKPADQGIETIYFRKLFVPGEMKSKSSETEKTVSTKKMGEEGT
ncbi:uncharacterized protein LOC141606577 isoform X1 [Silene latifolia]|uniref:uncharacterized protein LOC141606577 isoform X1 n=1 Tax=Silene latifolia TaxID=37657 RepID=UPI003D788A08